MIGFYETTRDNTNLGIGGKKKSSHTIKNNSSLLQTPAFCLQAHSCLSSPPSPLQRTIFGAFGSVASRCPWVWVFQEFPPMAELPVFAVPDASPELPELYPRIRSQSVGHTGKRMTLRCLCPLTSQTLFQNSEVCFWKQKPRRSSRRRWRRKKRSLASLLHLCHGVGKSSVGRPF